MIFIKNLNSSNKHLGFTLIELLVVVSIIGLLVSMVLAGLNDARDQAKTVIAVSDLREIRRAIFTYQLDTNVYPPGNPSHNPTLDPLQNSLGVAGWSGPYYNTTAREHPWGGPYKLIRHDANNDGIFDYIIQVDDDPIGGPNNGSQIPSKSLLMIDQIIDDGNLTSGDFQGNTIDTLHQAPGWLGTGLGEGVFVIWGE